MQEFATIAKVERYNEWMTQKEIISLYDRYRIRLYNTCYRIVGASDIAEELMHDTLLKYLRSDVRIASEEQRSAWLTRTAIRKSLDWLRSRKREKLFLEQYAQDAETIDASMDVDESLIQDAARVRDAILQMPPPYGIILNLVLLEGLDYDEIEQLTGIRGTTLRSHFSRGKQKLIQQLQSHD